MAQRTVDYYAISIFASKTFWFNALTVIVMLLNQADVVALIPPEYTGLVAAVVCAINILLRTQTERPVAMIPPNEVKPVEVKRLGPPYQAVSK